MTNWEAFAVVSVAFGLLQILRQLLDVKTRLPGWDAQLNQFQLPGALVLIGIGLFFDLSDDLTWPLALAPGFYTIWLSWSYRPARTLLVAMLPIVVVYFAEVATQAINSAFFNANEEFFSTSAGYAAAWLGTFFFIARQQKKRLVNEQLEREAQELRNRQITAENSALEHQVMLRTAELTRQKEELVQTVTDLRATQEQLVQKEKMASLGELTAGIAHEIQNPLNFVNNFAEVSTELIDELGDELRAGRTGGVQDLMDDIRQNLEKINYHGHRADAIVKAMLMHSRSSNGERQPTDINALCDEFLRLSYHGLRAKDSSFNATMLTDFDPGVGRLTIVGQEVGRVLLNLFNNAFYALSEKKKKMVTVSQNGQPAGPETEPKWPDYQPTIRVSTKKEGDRVFIKVYDNGCGIPQTVLDKIYQPFFTTKPAGEGTGLGLSLSYDIITKGHAGMLTVDTKEGEFTEFLIALPVR